MTAGQPYGISPGSPNRIRRIEGGVLDYASDITPDENPLELGLDRLIAGPISSARPRSRRRATKVFVGAWSASSSTALPCRRITSIAGP